MLSPFINYILQYLEMGERKHFAISSQSKPENLTPRVLNLPMQIPKTPKYSDYIDLEELNNTKPQVYCL